MTDSTVWDGPEFTIEVRTAGRGKVVGVSFGGVALSPRPAEVDSDWAEKIERAKQAREQSRKLRKRRIPPPTSRPACGFRHR